ncbi:hypothetical protein FS837_004247, partial [Tulasnella sp. UAMH 9824]
TLGEAIKSRNPSFADVEKVHDLLSAMSADLWERVSGYTFFFPVGPWVTDPIERQAGDLMRTSVIRIVIAGGPTLISFGVAPKEVDYWAEQVEAELMGGKVRQYIKFYQSWAVKKAVRTGDAEEHARLDAQHIAFTLMLRGLFPEQVRSMVEASLQTSGDNLHPAILDIGTGSGAWAIEMTRQYPNADVVGLDLVPVNAGSQRPSNCRFEICDANEGLDRYPSASFNVVHIRLTLQGVKDYHELFEQIHRMLRPGEVLLVLEVAFALFDANKELIRAENPDDPGFTWYHRLASILNEATKARNHSFVDIERVQELLSEMGGDLWESVSGFTFFMPVGPWPTDPIERQAGELIRDIVIRGAVSVRPALISSGMTPEEADHCAQEVQAELKGGKVLQCLKIFMSTPSFKPTMPQPAPSQISEVRDEPNPQLNHTVLRELHGGKVNALTDAYLLTGDAEEHARLDAQHTAVCLMLGGLFPEQVRSMVEALLQTSSDNPNPAILDVGTGSGAWAIEMARQFPNADVVGLDLVPVNAGSQRPSNCRFEICDANEGLDRYPSGSFNVVHIRLMLQGVKDYHKLFDQIHRMLRPGGVLLVLEAAFAVFDVNRELIRAETPYDPGFTWYHRLTAMFNKATKARNPSFADVERVDKLLLEVENESWENVSVFSFFMPVGPWAPDPVERQTGDLMRSSVLQATVSIRPALISFGISPQEANDCAEEVAVELKEGKVQQYLK